MEFFSYSVTKAQVVQNFLDLCVNNLLQVALTVKCFVQSFVMHSYIKDPCFVCVAMRLDTGKPEILTRTETCTGVEHAEAMKVKSQWECIFDACTRAEECAGFLKTMNAAPPDVETLIVHVANAVKQLEEFSDKLYGCSRIDNHWMDMFIQWISDVHAFLEMQRWWSERCPGQQQADSEDESFLGLLNCFPAPLECGYTMCSSKLEGQRNTSHNFSLMTGANIHENLRLVDVVDMKYECDKCNAVSEEDCIVISDDDES